MKRKMIAVSNVLSQIIVTITLSYQLISFADFHYMPQMPVYKR